jgi:CheY-like chemotaxis protein
VLVVDDEDDVREVIGEVLREDGYDVCSVANGADALAMATQTHFDAVTMDLRMPGMTGRETLEALRKLAPSVPVVVVSGYATRDDTKACRCLGAFEVLQKPFDVERLLAVVQAAIAAGRRCGAPS